MVRGSALSASLCPALTAVPMMKFLILFIRAYIILIENFAGKGVHI